MNKHILTYAAALAMMFVGGGCDDYNDNFDGLQDGTVVKDVKNIEMTLTEEEYKAIANNSANKALAKADGESKELGYLATDRHFSETITAAKYLPNYLAALYPTADNTSSVKVTSRTVTDLPEALSAIRAAGDYTVTAADYQSVWADVNAAYFTPSKAPERYIPGLLKAGMKDAAEGDYAVVSYQWSDNEPTTGGEEVETITPIANITAEGTYTVQGTVSATYARGFIVADATGAILVYLNNPANYSLGDVVKVAGDVSQYNGGMQFGNSAVVSLEGKTAEFAFPAAETMDGAALDTYLTNVSIKHVKLTGELAISGSFYNLNVAGAATAVGSLSFPHNGQIDASLNGKSVTVTGYLFSVSQSKGAPKYPNMIVTTIAEEGAEPEFTPVGIVATAKPGTYNVKGQVAATYKRGFLVNDGTGSVLVYLNKESGLEIGDLVSVSGTTSSYAGLNQYPATATVTKLNTDALTFKYPAIREMNGAEMDAYLEMPTAQYVRYSGTLSISGNYYNVIIDDAATAQGSLSYVNDGMIDPDLNGKQIVVEGYSIGVSSSKYFNTMVTSVQEASATTAAAAAFATRAVDTEEKLAVYYYDGSKWAAAAGTLIVNPADYTAMGLRSDFSSSNAPEKYLPDFLRLKQPYAQPEASVYVAYAYYNGKSTERRADEYVFDGSAWVKNAGIVEQTDQFIKNNGKWVWDPSVTIVLTPGKNQPLSTLYFQACVDWVKANVEDGAKYVSSYGNNDYYSGASAYQGNLDWRPNSAREQYAAAFEGMNDEQITALLKERTIEVLGHVLTQLHPEAKPVEGVEVLYNIQLGIYTGTSIAAPTHQLTYKVIGDAEFEFVSFDTL